VELVEMVGDLLRGKEPGPDMGWYHPGSARYGWRWLADRCGVAPEGAVRRGLFPGSDAAFRRLDRDGDGVLREADLAWNDDLKTHQERQRFKAMDVDGSGQITADEWVRFFEKAPKSAAGLNFDDFIAAFRPAAAPVVADDAPKRRARTIKWLKSVANCDVGSYFEGPRLNERVPDFTLEAKGGEGRITLSKFRGDKPTVLVFGSFSCGGFRSHYRSVEELHRRYGDSVQFLAVYIREAHPTDGLRSATNDRAGIVIKQPTLMVDRAAAARACSARLEVTIPMVVDEMDDRVGHAFSGMPNRLYLVDPEGKVVYKSGRGPFGFKAGELEQQILMLQLERGSAAAQQHTAAPAAGRGSGPA
jgi:hypothetical protein